MAKSIQVLLSNRQNEFLDAMATENQTDPNCIIGTLIDAAIAQEAIKYVTHTSGIKEIKDA